MNIDGHTKMYCLIGSPVGHSGSPAMYNYSFARTGMDSGLSRLRHAAGEDRQRAWPP